MSGELVKIGSNSPAAPANIARYLKERVNMITAAAASNINAEQICRVVYRTISMDAKLQECTCLSVYQSTLIACELGLTIGPGLGEAFLVPFNKVCTFMVGYKGLATLAYRSGVIDDITPVTVYRADEFRVEWHRTPPFVHIPNLTAPRSDDDIIAFYTLIHARGQAAPHFAYRTKQEVDLVRSRTAGRNSDAWRNWYSEQGMKTAIKHALKPYPKSVEMGRAIAWDNAIEANSFRDVQFAWETDSEEVLLLPTDDSNKQGIDHVERAQADAEKRKPTNDKAGLVPAPNSLLNEYSAACRAKGKNEMAVSKDLWGKDPVDMTTAEANAAIVHLEELQ